MIYNKPLCVIWTGLLLELNREFEVGSSFLEVRNTGAVKLMFSYQSAWRSFSLTLAQSLQFDCF